MKIRHHLLRARSQAGLSLVECLVYVAVFLILSSVAFGAFYFCWNGDRALIGTTDDVSAALHAGERWRADVRDASGAISVQTTASGETVKIPEGEKEVLYSFNSGEMRRQAGVGSVYQLILPKVKSSEISSETRGSVTAWRWELELAQRPQGTHLPLLFTFEAAQKTP